MEYLDKVLEVLGQAAALRDSVSGYAPALLMFGTLFCGVNAFFGYRLRKFWSGLFAFLVGTGGMLVVGSLMIENKMAAVALAFVVGLLLAGLAFYAHRSSLFLLQVALVYGVLVLFFPAPTIAIRILCLAAGLFAGGLMLRFERFLVISVTSICGGFGAAKLALVLLEQDSLQRVLTTGGIIALAGFALQFFTTRGEWEEEDDEEEEERGDLRLGKRSVKRKPQEKTVFQLLNESLRGEYEDDEEELEEYEEMWEEEEPEPAGQWRPYTDMDEINDRISREVSQIYRERKE